MLPHRARADRRSSWVTVLACLSAISLASCDKVPLLAPSGSVINLFATSATVPINGEVEIIATVIENGVAQTPSTGGGGTGGGGTGGGGTGGGGTGGGGTGGNGTGTNGTTATSTTGAGTPVQNGTLVSFTTTIGRIEPAEARTQNGQVRVKFVAGTQSGTATITAFSGGASARLTDLLVGAAAVERVRLSASPSTLGPVGGTTTISARVEDESGGAVAGVSVNFVADAGTLSAPNAVTDSEGVARTQLTTSRETTVTATVGGAEEAEITINLDPRTGLTITPPETQPTAGTAALFRINVAETANVRELVIDWGDGDVDRLGAINNTAEGSVILHVYDEPGTFVIRATATEASGFTETVSTGVSVLPAQPPTVEILGPDEATTGETVRLTARVSGHTSTVVRYDWTFGSGAQPPSSSSSSNVAFVRWTTTGTKNITVTVTLANGAIGDGTRTVTVAAALK
jgi:hypothetical protein